MVRKETVEEKIFQMFPVIRESFSTTMAEHLFKEWPVEVSGIKSKGYFSTMKISGGLIHDWMKGFSPIPYSLVIEKGEYTLYESPQKGYLSIMPIINFRQKVIARNRKPELSKKKRQRWERRIERYNKCHPQIPKYEGEQNGQ